MHLLENRIIRTCLLIESGVVSGMSKIGNSDRPEIVVLQSNYIHNIFIAACLPQRLCDLVFYVEDLLHNKSFGFSLQNVILNGNMLP